MNKLVLLSEVKKENKEVNSYLEKNNKPLENKYFDFEKNIFNNKLNLKIDEDALSNILLKAFLLNKKVFITFLNYIYDDFLGTNSNVRLYEEAKVNDCFLNNPSYVCKATVEDEYRKYEYRIEFQTKDIKNIAILILKKDLMNNKINVVNFRKRKEEYESLVENKSSLNSSNLCILMLNSNMSIPDNYKIHDNYRDCSDEINIIKVWKYDFKKLFEKELLLLFPIKILDLKNMMDSLKCMNNSHKTIEKEINRFYLNMDRYLEKLKETDLINDKDIDLVKQVSQDILDMIY